MLEGEGKINKIYNFHLLSPSHCRNFNTLFVRAECEYYNRYSIKDLIHFNRTLMKKHASLITILIGFVICVTSYTVQSQVPQSFKYQAVVRDRAGQVLPSQDINLQISILQSNTEGPEVYREMHSVTTSELGMVNIEVGKGKSLAGSFAAIDWSAGNYYLRIGMDPAGGTNFELMGFSQLLSVPYALYADKAGSGERTNDYDWQILGPDVVTGHGGSYPAGNVGVGNNAPQTLLYVAKNMGEPTITIRNMGGGGGATYAMVDDLSGANWKFKATTYGGFKIRDQAYGLDVLTMEPNSAANALYINSSGYVGLGTTTPINKLSIENGDMYMRDSYPFIYLDNTSTGGNTGITFRQNGDYRAWLYFDEGESLLRLNAQAAGGSRNDLVITSDARIGIGTASPTATFQVNRQPNDYTAAFGDPISSWPFGTNVTIGTITEESILYLGQNTDHKGFVNWFYNATPGNALFRIGTYSGSNPLILQPAGGNVGIGNYSPTGRLEVSLSTTEDEVCHLGYSTDYPAYIFHNETSTTDGQAAVYGYRSRNSANDGSGYATSTSNAAIKGYSFWGDRYSFGTTGFNFNDFYRCGGVLGAGYNWDDGDWNYWGSLGYKTSGGAHYGGYFTSHTSGAGKSTQKSIGIGIGAWGDLIGADIHGQVYGIYTEGKDYGLFSNGPVYRNNLDVHLQENKTGTSTVLYTSVSTEVTVQTSGYANLSGGTATIAFDPAFAASVSPESPIVVTVTPMGNSNGIYLTDVSKSGFEVVENNAGKSNVKVSYIAIGKRAGYEHPVLPQDIIGGEYTNMMARGLHNDADTETNGEGMSYENGRLNVGIQSTYSGLNKPAEETILPKPSVPELEPLNPNSPTGRGKTESVKSEAVPEEKTSTQPTFMSGKIPEKAVQPDQPEKQVPGISEDGKPINQPVPSDPGK